MVIIHTIGHGRKSADEIRVLLDRYGIGLLIDVRTYPSSKRNPQSARAEFERVLGKRYLWLGWALGGFKTESVVKNWSKGLDILIERASKQKVAIMCSEGLPEECHRKTEIVPALYELLPGEVTIVHILPDGAMRRDRADVVVQAELL